MVGLFMRAFVIAIVLTGGLGAKAARAADNDTKTLQGKWKLVSIEANGEAADPIGGPVTCIIKSDKLNYGGKEVATLAVDAKTSPKIIDLKLLNPDRVYEGIFAVDDGKLKVCLNRQAEGAKDRPATFSTKDQADWRLLVFEPVKEEVDAKEGLPGFAGLALEFDADAQEVVVAAALKDSPAEKAGLKKGDVILKVGTGAVTDRASAINPVRKAKPGDSLEFRVRRGKEEKTIKLTVGVLPFHFVAGLG